MFERADGYIVTQWEHSRLSGEVAAAMCTGLGAVAPDWCGAIAMHDWPHLDLGGLFDKISVPHSSDRERQELLSRLAGEIPLGPLEQLVVLQHWRRLLPELWQENLGTDFYERRRAVLLRDLRMTPGEADNMDRWCSWCDAVAFYLARGERSLGQICLTPPGHDVPYCVDWQIGSNRVEIGGGLHSVRRELSWYGWKSEGYPQNLRARRFAMECVVRAQLVGG
jgi:hypothetical protein